VNNFRRIGTVNTLVHKTSWFPRQIVLLRLGLTAVAIAGSDSVAIAQSPAARLRLAQPMQRMPVVSRGGTPSQEPLPMPLMPTPIRPASSSITERFGRLFSFHPPSSATTPVSGAEMSKPIAAGSASSSPVFGDLPGVGSRRGTVAPLGMMGGHDAGKSSAFGRGWEEFRGFLLGKPGQGGGSSSVMPVSSMMVSSAGTPLPSSAESSRVGLPAQTGTGGSGGTGVVMAAGGGTVPQNPVLAPGAENATASATIYSSPPAYRWYGWGTTTPGANPYAPSGKSPQASASWYSQSRATPGAFPVPAELPRSVTAPRNEPPMYAADPSASGDEGGVRSSASVIPTTRAGNSPSPSSSPASASPNPVAVTRAVPAIASPMVGLPPAVTDPPPVPLPGIRPAPVAMSKPRQSTDMLPSRSVVSSANSEVVTWKAVPGAVRMPAGGESESLPTRIPPPRVMLEREADSGTAEPAPLPPTVILPPEQLRSLILTACQEWVRDVEVTALGQGKIQVKFAAFSESHAHAAAEAVSQLPEVRGYEIGFEARISGR